MAVNERERRFEQLVLFEDDLPLLIDLDPDQTDEERERHGATRLYTRRQGAGLVEVSGGPIAEAR